MNWNRVRRSTVRRAPQGLPMLDRGAHRKPERGACLMEYVSVLAGVRFSDRPRCTHPALSQLARLVNDEVVDPAVRSRLAVLAPELIDTRVKDPRLTLTVVACCLWAALAVRPDGDYVQQALQHVLTRLRRSEDPRGRRKAMRRARWRGLLGESDAALVSSAFRLAQRHTGGFPGPRHDQQLCDLLEQAVTECRGYRAQPPRLSSQRTASPDAQGPGVPLR